MPDLLASSDSGASDSDNLTNLANVIVSGTTAPNAVVRVTRDGSLLATATASPAGVWAAPVTLVPGANVLRAASFDPASSLIGTPTAALTVTLDQTKPVLIPAESDFQFETGQSAVLTFNEAIASAPATVSGPGGSLSGGFSTSVTGAAVTVSFKPVLADGSYLVDRQSASDAAGNLAGPGSTLAFFVLAGPTTLPGLDTLRLKTAGWTFGTGQQIAAPADLSFFHYKVGDMNCDGLVNNQDIAPFVLGLTNPAGFQTSFGYSPALPGDVNGDSLFNNQDIALFVAVLTGSRPVVETTLTTVGTKIPRRTPFASGRTVELTLGDDEAMALVPASR